MAEQAVQERSIIQERPKEYALATVPLVQEMAQVYSFGSDLQRFENTLIKTVFPSDPKLAPVTNSQFLMFLGVAKAYKLNPFIREIFAFPNNDGSIVPIVSVDGWISLANRQADYDGVEFEYEWENGKVGGNLLSCTAVIFRRERTRPAKITELMSECWRDTKQWKQKPMRMLRHKAFIQGLRYAYGFGGIYDEDEGERILEGTLKPSGNGNFVSEIAMPKRVEQIAAPAKVTPEVFVTLSPEQQRKADVRPAEQAVFDAALEAGKAVGEILFRESPVQAALKAYAEEKPAEQVQNLDPEPENSPLQSLFDQGLVQKGTDGIQSGVGAGRAKRLYAILNKHKAHTEQEMKDEFLKPLGLEHVSEMPADIYDRVCAWAAGALEDKG